MVNALVWFHRVIEQNPLLTIDEYHFRLALDELLTNALHHGNANDSRAAIKVTISNTENNMNITVSDEGKGFREIPDPKCEENMFKQHGRGLCMLNSFGNVHWDDVMGCTRFDFDEQ